MVACFTSAAVHAEDSKYLYGLIDSQGHVILAPRYDKIGPITGNYDIPVQQNGKWGLVDRSGTVVLKTRYEGIRPLQGRDLIASVKVNGKWGLINEPDIMVVAPKYDMIRNLNSGYFLVGVLRYPGVSVQNGEESEKIVLPKIKRAIEMMPNAVRK